MQPLAAGTVGPSPLWYATRATGVVALVLLTVTVALGIVGVARLSSPQWPRMITAGLHRNLSLLVVAFVTVHVLTTVADSFTSISLVSAVIPFTSSYRPLWLSMGTVAFDMILAMVVTSLLRARLSYRAWRTMHWLAYACWPIALWHGLGTGTDARLGWLLLLDAACVLLVAAALLWRLTLAQPGPGRTTAITTVIGGVLATVAFTATGPLRPHWAERAGTPAVLLGSPVTSASAAATAPAVAAGSAASGWVAFSGRAAVSTPGPGQEVITVTARTAGTGPRDVLIVLRGAPDGAGISMSSGTVRVSPAAGDGAVLAGPVTMLSGAQVDAALRGTDDAAMQAHLILAINGNQVTGRLLLQPEGSR